RVSFRLSFAALFCDIGYSGHVLINLVWVTIPSFLCGYLAWAIVFFALASIFFIDCIALNLHIVFVNEYKRHNFENYYFIIAFSFALLLSLLPVADNMYGHNDVVGGCWYRFPGQKKNIIWEWITFFGWVDVSILYCVIVIIMVVRKLKLLAKQTDVFDFSSDSRLPSHPSLINKAVILSVVRKVVLYPVVPVAQIFCSFNETCFYVSHASPYPIMIGFLNALVFSQDIAVALLQPSFLEWLRYMLLIKLFSPPKSSINTFVDNESNTSTVLVGKDDSKQDIILDNQNDDQDIHLTLFRPVHLRESFKYSSSSHSSRYLSPSISSDPLIGSSQTNQTNINNMNKTNVVDILNCAVDGDEGRKEVEIMLKRL
ncbi:7417_t:CDS:2, partial [Dentiscutata erythropus]